MSKNVKTYLLIAIVLIIWGMLIYKVVDALAGNDEVVQDSFKPEPFQFNLENDRDKFKLIADYRDPFLGTIKQKAAPKPTRNKTPKKNSQPTEPLPLVTYSGYMTDPKNGERVFFININNQQVMLKPNESAESLKLISGNEKAVVLQYGNERLTIPISN